MTFMQDFNSEPIVKNTEGEISFSPSFSLDAKPVNTDDLWRKIYTSITQVLSRRFADDRKRKIKPFTDRIAFACPYCGDSSKDMSKKRGNVFIESMNYHCFNGDCNTHMSLYFFLKDQGELSSFTPEEQMHIQQQTAEHAVHTTKKIRVFQDIESLLSEEAMNLTVSREFFMKTFRLQEIKGSRIERYLTQRLQKDFHKFAFDPRKGLLYVMNLTKDGSRLLGYQIKTFNKRNPYLTYKTLSMHKELKIYKEQNKDLLEKLDTIAGVFGIMNLDLNKTVTVFEGPLDSFLFPNSVGVCSAKNDFPFEVESIRYFYDNDATGKDWAMRRLEQGFPVFLWRKYIQDNELATLESKIKDLNDLLIEANRRSLKLKKFVDFFGSDKYDIIWV